MDILANLTPEAVNELLDHQLVEPISPAVTIYIPMHKNGTPPNMTEDQIRTKNLVHRAIQQLDRRGGGKELSQQLRAWLEEVFDHVAFWESQTEGLLLCARTGMMRMYRLPLDTEEYVAVSDRFHLAPLLGLMQDMRDYYVLAVTQHTPHLLKGSPYGLTPSGVELPLSLESALNLDEVGYHREQQRSAGGMDGGYNGRGGLKDSSEFDRLYFWRLLDQVVAKKIEPKVPLILAGINSELAEYRSVASYPKILATNISANFNANKRYELFNEAQAAIRRELLDPLHDSALEDYRRTKGQTPDQASYRLAAIRTAAENGRIDKLLVPGIRETTDTVRDSAESLPVLTFPFTSSLAQAVHDIASMVWSSRGKVIDIDPGRMPERGALLLATLRY